ncbi:MULTISPECIES: peptidoglycan DD-metalloendopeptidase family protein [unclassified Arthrobacter]|uniref:peptidoglycan DD-metalloendopeptidase family protein n=1 Tax=unclassified Arthrobacter TaxID=235627 RepID=UPI002E0D2A24|nr:MULTISPECIES: peptidoglycan DD-metalloendopeptidase family protein [unclassified Arthrobacter]
MAPSRAAMAAAMGPEPLAPAARAVATATADASATASDVPVATPFTADARALVAYARSNVQTTSRDGVPGELNVASAGLKRPAVGFLMAPLESLRESSPFGLRTSPISGSAGEFHWGQDYAAACGTRVYAADAGVVRAVGWHPWGGGNRVEIDHGNGLITTYNHLEAIAVKKGDSVRVGEVIARVGTTGSSTGCHLHFETILNGAHKNPHDWVLLPIAQTDPLGPIEMTSYAPEAGLPANAGLGWAIPVSDDRRHEVAGGAEEVPVAATPRTPSGSSAAASPTPSVWDGLSPTRTSPAKPTAETSRPPAGPSSGTTAPVGSQPPSDTPTVTPPGTGTPPGTATPPPSSTPPGTAMPPPSSTPPGTAMPPPSSTPPGTATPPPPVLPPPVLPPVVAPPPVLPPVVAPPPVLPPVVAPPPVQPPVVAPPPVLPPVVAPPPVQPTVAPVLPPVVAPPPVQPTVAPVPPPVVAPPPVQPTVAPAPPTVVAPPAPPTVVAPPAPPTVVAPPAPPPVVAPPAPPPVVAPPAPPTVVAPPSRPPAVAPSVMPDPSVPPTP